jgi:hypothetical protein
MVLARNTYRFGLLVIAFGIAEGVRTMGGYGADVAGIGFLVGALGLFGGTLAHLARGPEGSDGGGPAGEDDDRSGGDDGPDDERESDDSPVTSVTYGPPY